MHKVETAQPDRMMLVAGYATAELAALQQFFFLQNCLALAATVRRNFFGHASLEKVTGGHSSIAHGGIQPKRPRGVALQPLQSVTIGPVAARQPCACAMTR